MAEKLINPVEVRNRFGGISDMTLWRWLDNAELKFPRPVYIQKRRFWKESEIEEFIERMAAASHNSDAA